MKQTASIKLSVKLGKTFTETLEMLRKAYGDQVLSRTTFYEWFKRFKEGRESLDDDERSGRPVSNRTNESVKKIRELIRKDRCMSVRLIEDITDISKLIVYRILSEDLKLRKICARFVPHTLSDDQKYARVLLAQDIILTYNNDPNFLKTIVAADVTWCFQYEPLTKRQSEVWKSPEDSPPRKVRLQKSKVKTMLITFFDSEGMIYKEFIHEGSTMNGQY